MTAKNGLVVGQNGYEKRIAKSSSLAALGMTGCARTGNLHRFRARKLAEKTQPSLPAQRRILGAGAAGAVEFGHGAFHVLARGIGGGADTLDAKTEIVRVAGAQNCF